MFAKFVSLLLALGFILLLAGCAAKEQKIPEPVSGEYSVLKKSGEGYLSGVLKFDFENGGFMGGAAVDTSSWLRGGTLTVEGSRITVVADLPKYDMTKDPPEPIGNYIWIFEVKEDGTLRFVPEGSDEFKVDHGTFPLNENSVLVRTGDLKKPINAGQGGS